MLALYDQAQVDGCVLTSDQLVRCGQAYEWSRRPASALTQYEAALAHAPADALDVRQRILRLRLDSVATDPERIDEDLAGLIADARTRPELLVWALEKRLNLLVDRRRFADARGLLETELVHLEGTSEALSGEYLTAVLHQRTGEFDQAELVLRNLRSRLSERNELDARSGWLLGVVVLNDEGPQRPLEALSFFDDVLTSHPNGPYATASQLGLAEALAQLQRFDEALVYYRKVLDKIGSSPATGLIDLPAVISSLTVRSRLQYEDGHDDSALDFLQLASDLVDRRDVPARLLYLGDLAAMKRSLAQRRRLEARASGDAEAEAVLAARSRELFLAAADDFMALAHLDTADANSVSEALWQAAVMYDDGGNRRKTAALLEDFLISRSNSSLIPLVLFRLGQAYQADGNLLTAVERYQQVIRDHTRTAPAQDAIIPLASCFMMLGPEYLDEAEQTLLHVVDDVGQQAMFTPQSLIYRHALFTLGELYSRQGRYEEAIERLDEALQRYPDDSRRSLATFQLADAYRQSGVVLAAAAAEAESVVRRQEMLRLKNSRLVHAEGLFAQVIDLGTEGGRGPASDIEKLQLMLSYSYRADSAFDRRNFEVALNRYQEVIRAYPEEPIALSAYAQVISCLESLGRVDDIGPALRRAQYLVSRIDAQRYDRDLYSRGPEDWQRMFAWIGEAGGYTRVAN
jgi:tetratricopeptide (TPR) repeat protein